jgi:L-ascorbate metabolism protein UlaG (beta-lactamase superfamily)
MTFTLSTWGHACVRIERDGRRLVLDPGAFSDHAVLADADAVLITHEHPDHLDPVVLAGVLAERPALEVWAPEGAVRLLREAGAPTERLHVAHEGDTWEVAGFSVRGVGHAHAVIHPDAPVPENVGYLVDGTLLHPGDSFVTPPEGTVDVLLVPVAGPWMKVAEAVEYVRAVRPRLAVPIHDAIMAPAGLGLVDRLVGGLGGAGEYRRLAIGEAALITPGA